MRRGLRRLARGPERPPDLDQQYTRWLARSRVDTGRIASGHLRVSVATVVTTVAEPWLTRAIESMLDQTHVNWELLLVSDTAPDSPTRSALDRFAARDARIRVLHSSPGCGIGGGTNEGIRAATGAFVAFLHPADTLYPDALAGVVEHLTQHSDTDVLYTDEDEIGPDGRRTRPFFKPDWSPDLLLSFNYIGRLTVMRRSLLQDLGGLRPELSGSEHYDVLLRAAERTARIRHLPRVLYGSRRVPERVVSGTGEAQSADAMAMRVVDEALARRGLVATVQVASTGRYHVRYALHQPSLVSLVIPMRNRVGFTRRCLASIERCSTYLPREIVLVDNGSSERASLDFLEETAARHRVVRYPGPFNYSAICNAGARVARGQHLLFLNNDTQVETPDWLEALLEHSQRREVGAVGAQLLYPDRRIQHGGVFLMGQPTAFAGHAFKHLPEHSDAWRGLAHVVRDVSAVTGACLMLRREVFEEVRGFDEAIAVAFGDVDLCLRLRARGYLIVYTPLARLLHHESATRRGTAPRSDNRLVSERWRAALDRGDPYYNPNLTRTREDVGLDG